jgi:hypothetical protein
VTLNQILQMLRTAEDRRDDASSGEASCQELVEGSLANRIDTSLERIEVKGVQEPVRGSASPASGNIPARR